LAVPDPSPETNGFAERFSHLVQEEFLGGAFCNTFYESFNQLRIELNVWVVFDNHQGSLWSFRAQALTLYQAFLKERNHPLQVSRYYVKHYTTISLHGLFISGLYHYFACHSVLAPLQHPETYKDAFSTI
jgi:hypothetical protein